MTHSKKTYVGGAVRRLAHHALRQPFCAALWRWDGQTMTGQTHHGKSAFAAFAWLAEEAADELIMGRCMLFHAPEELYLPAWTGRIEGYEEERLEDDRHKLRQLEIAHADDRGGRLVLPHRAELRSTEPVLSEDARERQAALIMAFAALRQAIRYARARGGWLVNEHDTPRAPGDDIADPYSSLSGSGGPGPGSGSTGGILVL